MNLIKQIVKEGQYGTQTIKMIVKENERGPQGEKGEPGDTATIAAGQSYSVPSSESPSVINVGSSTNAVFDFYIPKGEKGQKGDTGEQGERGPQGERGLTGPRGAQGPVGPQGPAGADGKDGKDGAIQYTAGSGIRISSNNVISATGGGGGSYVAGAGININDDTISVDTTTIQSKLTAGSNITISGSTISATDTTYSAFTGTTGTSAGTAGLVPAPATTDAGKFLKADGTWATAGGGGGAGVWGQITGDIADQTDLQTEFAKYTPTANLATVATTGAYSDLTGTPTIPAAQVNSDWNATSGVAQILNKPTIPTVNNATLTIQKNGAGVATFTANASSNATANIEVPTITMTTTDPGEGSALAADNFVAVYGGDPIVMDYSTSEVNTGAKWIDGSAIYKKTVNFGALPNATNKRVSHGISNLNLVIKVEGFSKDSNNIQRPTPYTHLGSSVGGSVLDIESSDIVIYTDSDRSGSSAYITLYYTKSA